MAKDSSSGLSSALPGGADTIVARATAHGPGALAVVRMSGLRAGEVGQVVCPRIDLGSPWKARLTPCVGTEGEALDDGIVLFFKGPKSYTGEDMVEVILHGSEAVVSSFVRSCEQAGARRATPGEFTRRAVANNKMDLLQAEAVNDLIQAETAWQLRLAREQLQGRLSTQIGVMRDRLVGLMADIEGSLDFVDQGVVVADDDVEAALEGCRQEIRDLLDTATAGEWVREGVRVVLSGPTNSGKSTLFNTLLRNDKAIITAHPGTTRDPLEARLDVDGIETILVDTAGLRDTDDPVEREGVRRAWAEVGRADVVLVLTAAGESEKTPPLPEQESTEHIYITSKADLEAERPLKHSGLRVSCVTGEGVAELREKIRQAVTRPLRKLEGTVAVNRRHKEPLHRALGSLDSCRGAPREVIAAELADAAGALHEMVGDIGNEAVLDEVFARFCVGK